MVTSLSQIEETKDYDGATEFGNLGVTSVTLARAVPGTTGTGVGGGGETDYVLIHIIG